MCINNCVIYVRVIYECNMCKLFVYFNIVFDIDVNIATVCMIYV